MPFFLVVSKKAVFLPPKNKGVPFLPVQDEKAEIIPSYLIRIMPA